jgi:hypothetical protein
VAQSKPTVALMKTRKTSKAALVDRINHGAYSVSALRVAASMTLPKRSLAITSVCPKSANSANLLRASFAVSTTTENELSLTLACIQYGTSSGSHAMTLEIELGQFCLFGSRLEMQVFSEGVEKAAGVYALRLPGSKIDCL